MMLFRFLGYSDLGVKKNFSYSLKNLLCLDRYSS